MKLSDHGIRLIAELARREPAVMVSGSDENAAALKLRADTAADLRSWYHPKQGAFFTSKATRRATSKTRRAGITSGGCRELLARCLETDGYRATYAATTMDEARDRAWLNDTKTGLIDILRQKAERIHHKTLQAFRFGGIDIIVHDGDSYLEFGNGSEIELFGAEHEKAQRKKRGVAKHVIWVDEAQDFPALENFLDAAIGAAMSDFGGEIWITGTPGRDCLGRFYDITKDIDEGRLPNWEVHVMNVTDNPKFGRVVEDRCDDGTIWWVEDNLLARTGPFQSIEDAEAEAIKVRWDRTAGAEILEKNLNGDEPDFVREWLGRWVKEDARYVYPIHSVPKHKLLYAPQRLVDNPFKGSEPRFGHHPPWYDHDAALADLPRPKFGKREYQWMFAIGADFGFDPDPFALVVWAFCSELTDVYEMFSWKCPRVNIDDQGAYIKLLWDAIGNIAVLVGDPAGMKSSFDVWRNRLNIPIDEANKAGKNELEAFLADDVRRGRVHLREESPLHLEMKHLAYLPTKPGKTREVAKTRKVNGVVHGDHCCFIGSTMIETPTGPVRISDVRVGDMAMTRVGPRPVLASFSSGIKETWRLTTETGSVIGTPDHPMLTALGWKPLASLTQSDTVFLWANTERAKLSRSMAVDTGAIPTPITGRRGSTSYARSSEEGSLIPSTCTERSGCRPTAPSLMASTSTTSMATRSTTRSGTLRWSTGPSISASTRRLLLALRLRGETSRPRRPQLSHGTTPLMGLLGTSSKAAHPCSPVNPSSFPASDAAPSSSARSQAPSSAATRARRRSAAPMASTTSRLSAESAGPRSIGIGITAPLLALVRVVGVERVGLAEVFNLTVDGVPEFFADGVISHNCDAGRYSYNSMNHFLSTERQEKPKPGTTAAYKAEEKRLEDAVVAEDRRIDALADLDEQAAERGYEGYGW